MPDIEVKQRDNYNGRATIFFATIGGGKFSDIAELAHQVAKAAGCKLNDINFRLAGKGNWIMGESPPVPKD
jgi:hypothetical protein